MSDIGRLYPTIKEEQEREALKKKLGLARTSITKGGGMPNQPSRKELDKKKQVEQSER